LLTSDKPEIRLGKMEMAIMNAVWDHGRSTVHEVKEAISIGKKPAYSTVLTMMRKLEAKGYLEHEVDGRTYVYRSTLSRQVVRHSLLGDLLKRVFNGSPALLLSSLIEQDKIDERELEQIRNLLQERDKKNEIRAQIL